MVPRRWMETELNSQHSALNWYPYHRFLFFDCSFELFCRGALGREKGWGSEEPRGQNYLLFYIQPYRACCHGNMQFPSSPLQSVGKKKYNRLGERDSPKEQQIGRPFQCKYSLIKIRTGLRIRTFTITRLMLSSSLPSPMFIILLFPPFSHLEPYLEQQFKSFITLGVEKLITERIFSKPHCVPIVFSANWEKINPKISVNSVLIWG